MSQVGSGLWSKSSLFTLSVTEMELIAAANPNLAKMSLMHEEGSI